MNRLVRGSVILAAAFIAGACASLDTPDDVDQTERLFSDPAVVFVANTDSQAVFVEALNSLGQQLEGDFEVTNVGAGLFVARDTAFAPIAGVGHLPTRARFFVRAADPATFVSSSFTVEANGEVIDIPVRITPASLVGNFSNPSPAVGDTVTITAPANLRFTPTTTSVANGGSAFVVGISADSMTASVVIGPGALNSTISFNDVLVTYLDPTTLFDGVVSTGTVTTPLLSSFPLSISSNSPAIGDELTVVIPAPFKYTAGSDPEDPAAPILVTSVSPDSATITFLIGPNADTVVSIDSLIVSGVPGMGRFTLTTAANVISPVLTSIPVVFSSTTPAGGAPVTMTAPAGFSFFPTVSVSFGPVPSFIVSASAGSVTFVPRPGSIGAPTIANFGATGSPLALSLPASTALTVGNTPTGTNAIATAPTIALAASGNTVTYYDGGSFGGTSLAGFGANFPTRYYKVVVAAPVTIDVRLNWNNNDDLGLYIFDGATCVGPCDVGDIIDGADSFGGGAGGHPETASGIDLAAGTYYFGVVEFNTTTGPPVFEMMLTTQ